MQNGIMVLGRVLLGQMFLMAGVNKIGAFAGTQAYMESMGVPGMMLIPVIVLEIAGGLAVILGWQTRWSTLALAGFTVIAAMVFHHDFANQMQSILFMKNMAITGGLLMLSVTGAGAWSLDSRNAVHRDMLAGA